MWSRIRSSFRGERGSAMVVAVFASMMILMVAGAAVDLGLYYVKYQRAKNVASSSKDLVKKTMAVYLAEMTKSELIEDDVVDHAVANGLDEDKLYISIERTMENFNGTKKLTFYYTYQYIDPYDCIFLPIIGINQLPVDVGFTDNLTIVNAHIWEEDDPYVTWRPDRVIPSDGPT